MLLPQTPKELFKFGLKDKIRYHGLITFFTLTGLWRRSQKKSGDIETMTFMDKVYWLYKTTHPVRKPRRGSKLEAHFNQSHEAVLPKTFVVEKEVTVSAVGDLINHPFLAASKDSIYREVEDLLFGADLSMANLECPISLHEKKAFVFSTTKAPPLFYDLENFQSAKGTHKNQFQFMSTACNHSLDFSEAGVKSTIETLKANDIAFNGVQLDEKSSRQATLLERKGIKIGIISHTFGVNAYEAPPDKPWIVNRMKLNEGVVANDFTQMKAQLHYCREQGVQFIIGQFHWGMEHEFYPMPEQVELAHHCAELGFDAIIGHHPHVIQPFEVYQTKRDVHRRVPIFYSLGNLINSFSAEYLTRSAIAKFNLAQGKMPDGSVKVYVHQVKQDEVRQHVDAVEKKIWITPVQRTG